MKRQLDLKRTVGIAAAYTGTLFGAGFVSGQEILRFFAAWGGVGLIGTAIAGAGFAFLGVVIMQLAAKRNSSDFERIICPVDGFLPKLVSVLMSVWLFGIITVMLSAASELFSSLTGLDGFIGAAALTAVLIAMNLAGTKGLAGVFTLVVPVMFVIGAGTAATAAATGGADVLTAVPQASLTVAPHWLWSAFLYISYNILGCIGVLAPLGRECTDSKSPIAGAIAGGAVPGIYAALLCAAMLANRTVAFSADMPMYAIARSMSPALGLIYALSLFAGIFTAASGISFSLLNRVSSMKLPGVLQKRTVTVPIVCVAALVGSRLGFASLVGTVYPAYGYVGFLAIVLMIINLIRARRKPSVAEAEQPPAEE